MILLVLACGAPSAPAPLAGRDRAENTSSRDSAPCGTCSLTDCADTSDADATSEEACESEATDQDCDDWEWDPC